MPDALSVAFHLSGPVLRACPDLLTRETELVPATAAWTVNVALETRTLAATDLPLWGEGWEEGPDDRQVWLVAVRRAQLFIRHHYATYLPGPFSLPADRPGLVSWALREQGPGFASVQLPMMLDHIAQSLRNLP